MLKDGGGQQIVVIYRPICIYSYTGASKKIYNIMEKLFFYCNLFQKVKLSYILDSLHVK